MKPDKPSTVNLFSSLRTPVKPTRRQSSDADTLILVEELTEARRPSNTVRGSVPRCDERSMMDEPEIRYWLTKLSQFESSLASRCEDVIGEVWELGSTYLSNYLEVVEAFITEKKREQHASEQLASRLSMMARDQTINTGLTARLFSTLNEDLKHLSAEEIITDRIMDAEQQVHSSLLNLFGHNDTAVWAEQASEVPQPNDALLCFLASVGSELRGAILRSLAEDTVLPWLEGIPDRTFERMSDGQPIE